MGRPSKLTPERQARLIQALTAGNYLEPACSYAGIDQSTYHRWMDRGESEKTGPYREFRQAVELALAAAEVRTVAHWQSAIPGSWQAARDFLARRYPARWGADRKPEPERIDDDFVLDLSPPESGS